MLKNLKSKKGLTLTELVVVLAVLSVLASVAMPVLRFTVKRTKEAELKRDLREMRDAIDSFKKTYDEYREVAARTGQQVPSALASATDTGYPKNLEDLTKVLELPKKPEQAVQQKTGATDTWGKSVSEGDMTNTRKIRFLRKIPTDPMTGNAEWGTRSSSDEPDSSVSDENDVFDVYSKSDGTALNGTKYSDW